MGTNRDSGLGIHERAAIQRYPMEARKLPEHGETWFRIDIELDHGALNTFSRAGIVKKRGVSPDKSKRHYWETAQKVTDWVEKHTQKPNTPCGQATGIRTIEPGTYTCTDDDCDCRMSRAEAEEVVA